MCGIWGGMSSTLSDGEIKMVNLLGFLSQLRGMDSAGVCLGHRPKEGKYKKRPYYLIFKDVGDYNHLATTSMMAPTIKNAENTFSMIGHCRAATVGHVTRKLAHPFHSKDIIGVHNGTISKLEDKANPGVSDSLKLYEMMGELGFDGMIKEIGDDGAMALVWVDLSVNNHSLNFYRNQQRTLFHAFNKSDSSIFWASEGDFLSFAERRSSPVLGNITSFDTGYHYKIPFGSMKMEKRKVDIPSKKTTVVFSPMYSNTEMDWWEDQDKTNGTTSTRIEPASVPFVPRRRTTTTSYEDKFMGWKDKLLDVRDAEEILECGCSMCGETPTLKDVVYFIAEEEFVCADCVDDLGYENLAQLTSQVYRGELVEATVTTVKEG